MAHLTIISDGMGKGTKVMAGDVELEGVEAIEIERIDGDNLVRVKLHVALVNLGTDIPNAFYTVEGKENFMEGLEPERKLARMKARLERSVEK